MTRRHIMTGIRAFASVGFAYSGLFATIALWQYGWSHSAFAAFSAMACIVHVWTDR